MKTNKYNIENYIAYNSYGGFNLTGDEYHILNTNTPLPWCNVMANENFGTVVSSYGTVYTYFKNSSQFKLTNWCNDWITFEPGEKFKGIYEKNYNLVYGFGYTNVLEEDDFLKKKMEIFIPKEDNIKIQYISLENKTENDYTHTIEYSIAPVLGVTYETNIPYILCRLHNDVLEFKNPYSIDFSNITSYIFTIKQNNNIHVSYDTDKYITTATINIPAKSTISFAIIIGATENSQDIEYIKAKYSTNEDIENELQKTKQYWRSLVVKDFKLEDKYLEIMANGWLLYQTIVCRLYAKSAFYQSGGAIGYRDQLQDTLCLLNSWPEKTRSQIILHSSKQFEKGDVLHWWHEYNNTGIRTYFSDDYLWLPYVLSEYISVTKDYSILNVSTKYLEDKSMGDKRELYDKFLNIDKEDSVYDHAKKAIMYGLSRISEKNGLLDIGDGDWNDGFSSIRGQSVWLTFFMMDVLKKFKEVSTIKEDFNMVKTCDKFIHIFKNNLVENTWDEDHFVRAFFENGDVLGSNLNDECKIDLISQVWAVIALKNYPDMQEELKLSLQSVEKYLIDKKHMIVKLLYPAFDKPKNNPGYIKAYVPGTRENGGQYTHAVTWLAKAYFEFKEYDKGVNILKMINPISHSDTKEKADIYMVEPFAVAADIYSNQNHIGRGGWTWYTGSSAWMYKIIDEYMKKGK
ncbi:MAG: hypothetical protein RSB67_00310 [Clostridia bacterium]